MKTNSRFSARLLSLLMAIMMMFTVCSLTSFAAVEDVNFTLSVQNDIEEFKTILQTLGDKKYKKSAKEGTDDIAGNEIIVQSAVSGAGIGDYVFKYSEFVKLETKSQQKFITDLMNQLKSNNISATATQEISDALSSADSSVANLLIPFVFDDLGADMATAYKWVAPVLGTLRIILGVLAIGVLVILLISTVLDCAYIGLPMFREMTNGKNGEKEGKKPFGVSYDAFKTIMEAESAMSDNGNYKNPYGVYFKRRAVTYIILALCLFYLVAGEMSGLISWLLSLVSGITG